MRKNIKTKKKLGDVYVHEMNARHEKEIKLAKKTSPVCRMVKIVNGLFVAPREGETDAELINRITKKLRL